MTRHDYRPRKLAAKLNSMAFTLIELLVVMAITAILLGLIFGPLIQGFNLTNRARVQVLTQDTARRAMEIGMRDISNGVFVFDNAQQPVNLWVRAFDASNNPIVTAMPFTYAMVDMVPPARYSDQDATLQPKDTDPTTGLAISRGDLALPVAPGRVITRYFLGLRDNTCNDKVLANQPTKPYANYYSSPNTLNLLDHNPVILYRAVISPYLPDGRVDERFFAKDVNTKAPILYDANFFYDTTPSPANLPGIPGFTSKDPNAGDAAAYNARGYGERWDNWKAVARAMVPTDRADEVVQLLDDDRKPTFFTFNNITYPRLNPLVRFQPTYVGNDAGTPTSIADAASGAPSVPASAYIEQYGHWTTPFRLYMYRGNLNANPIPLFYWLNQGVATDPVQDQSFDPSSGNIITTDAYLEPNQSPKTYGINAQQTLLLDPTSGIQINPLSETKLFAQPPKILFTADARRGAVNCAFPDSVMLHASKANNYRPTPSQWLNDTDVPNNSLTMPNVSEINDRADRLYKNPAFSTHSANIMRYIRLASPPSNGGNSPLNLLPNAIVVPGSLVVKGPDMHWGGPNQGREVVYKQVMSDVVGPNEYRFGDPTYPVNQTSPDPALQDMLNAKQELNTIIFDSAPDVGQGDHHGLPTKLADGVTIAAPITATYQFQSNGTGYSVKADYLTRQLMTFSLGVRLYEFNSGQPQQVTLTQKIKVRNLQR